MIAAAAAMHTLLPLDTDIYWLCSVCRRVLTGAVLYRDIVETNPPMAVWIYLPAVWIEQVTALPAEAAVVVMVLIGGAASALAFARLAGFGLRGRWLALAVMLLAPLSAFAEREHIAMILMLPVLGVCVRRARGEPIPVWAIVMCGALAGIAPMIKPHFALGLGAAYIALATVRRDWKSLFAPEIVLAAALAVAYAAAVASWMPVYAHDVMPLLFDVYRPMRKPLAAVLLSPQVVTWVIAVACLWSLGRRFDSATIVLLAASAGFLAGFIEQGRGWAYHALPALSVLILAVGAAAGPWLTTEKRLRALIALAAAVSGLAGAAVFTYPARGVAPVIRSLVRHPTVMSITADQAPGHPIATLVHGTWVGTYSSRWITANSRALLDQERDPGRRARLQAWQAFDRAAANRDLTKRPDVVLVGLGPYDWHGWIDADPRTKQLMAEYVLVAKDEMTPQKRNTYEGVEAWVRRDLVRR